MVHVFDAAMHKADYQLNRGLKTCTARRWSLFSNATEHHQKQQTQLPKNMESMMGVQKVAGGSGSTSEKVRRSAEGYSMVSIIFLRRAYFLRSRAFYPLLLVQPAPVSEPPAPKPT